MKCYICEKGDLTAKKVPFAVYGVELGKFDAEVCAKCGETFFNEETSDKIDGIAKSRGLWGLEATTKVGIVGNSVDIKINKKIADFTGLKKGAEVKVYPESKSRIILEAV